MPRADFPRSTVQSLARRAAYVCSNPDCGVLAVEPNSDGVAASTFGEAAHIAAATEGGPRFDQSMTDEERASYANGIWLCASCHTKVDKDEARYPKQLLHEWKLDHATWVAAGGASPDLPEIKVASIGPGLSVPPTGLEEISAEENLHLRETRIEIQLSGRGKIVELELECQLPERVYRPVLFHRPPGCEVIFEPRADGYVTMGSVEFVGGAPPPPRRWRLAVANLYSRGLVDLRIRTADPEQELRARPGSKMAEMVATAFPAPRYWLNGTMSWDHRGAIRVRPITVVLSYEPSSRVVVSAPPTSDEVRLQRVASFP